MRFQIQHPTGTAAEWTAANPVLAKGELGFESDTNKVKIGDGISQWSILTYTTGGTTTGSALGPAGAIAGNAATAARYDHTHTSTASSDTYSSIAFKASGPTTLTLPVDNTGTKTVATTDQIPALSGSGIATTASHSDHDHSDATTSTHGFMSSTDKTAFNALNVSSTGNIALSGTAHTFGSSLGNNTLTIGGNTSTVVFPGNIQVQGTTTTVNSATLNVTNKTVTVNQGGTTAGATSAGLIIEGDSGSQAGYVRSGVSDTSTLVLKAPTGNKITVDCNADSTVTIAGNLTLPTANLTLNASADATLTLPTGNATIPSTTGAIANVSGGALGSIPYQSAANTTSFVAPNTSATKQFFTQTGTGTVGASPAWGTISQTDVSGTVPTTRNITAGSGISGGGTLSGDVTISSNFTTSGGTNGTATTVARGDHGHSDATTTVDGFLSAVDKSKLDTIIAYDQYQDWIINTASNITSSTVAATVNTAFYIAGSANSSWGLGSLKNVGTCKLVVETTVAVTTCYVYMEFSLNGGTSWVLEDGTTASTVANAITANVVVQLASLRGNSRVFTPGSAITAIGDALRTRLVIYDTTRTTGTQIILRAGIQAKPSNILGAAAIPLPTDKEIEQGDLTDSRQWSPHNLSDYIRRRRWLHQRLWAGNGIKVGLPGGIRRAKRIDVTSSTQAGSSYYVQRSNGTYDCRARLWGLIQAIRSDTSLGGAVLYFPPSSGDPASDYYALTTGPLMLCKDLILTGKEGYRDETVLRSVYSSTTSGGTTTFKRNTLRFGYNMFPLYGATNASHTHVAVDDIVKGQNYIDVLSSGDMSHFTVGCTIFLKSAEYYYDTGGGNKWVQSMHNVVVGIIGQRLQLLWDIPFSLSTNSTYTYWNASGHPTIFNTDEVNCSYQVADDPYIGAGNSSPAIGASVYHMTLQSDTSQVIAMTMPIAGEICDCKIVSAGAGIYGNGMQNSRYENVETAFAYTNTLDSNVPTTRSFMEMSACCFGNTFYNITSYTLSDVTAGTTLQAFQEGSSGNVIDGWHHIQSPYGTFTPASSNRSIMKDTGRDNVIKHSSMYLYQQSGPLFWNADQGTTTLMSQVGWTLTGRRAHDITVIYDPSAGCGQLVSSDSTTTVSDHIYEGIKVSNPASGTPNITATATSTNMVFRDWDVTEGNIVIQSGADNIEVSRFKAYSGNGFTNSTSGTVISSARNDPPEMWRYQR